MFRVVSHLSRVRLLLKLLTFSSVANAQLSQDCTGLGEAMVEHSCFHATFGPFVSVPGTPGQNSTADTPNSDSVHTEYRVGLPLRGEPHVVSYSPQRSGNWSIFTSADLPLQVLDDEGNTRELVFQQEGNTGCDALPIARVYSLTAKSRYQLQLGPADLESVVLVIEYADDFLVRVGPDADRDGFGAMEGSIVSNCRPPEGFAPNTADCDDTNPDVHPDAVERCDGVDQNCNGSPDDVGLQCRAGSGECATIGAFTCTGDTAVCDAAPVEPTAEVCNGKDDNCDGTIDESKTLCSDADQPRCVRKDFAAFCGCLLDTDCGSLTSGRVCDVDSATCIDGCSQQAGGNGCPDGQRCESEASPAPGLCVRDKEDEPAVPREQTGQRGIAANSETGCQCTLGHGGSTSGSSILALLAVVFGWLLRTRRSTFRTDVRHGSP